MEEVRKAIEGRGLAICETGIHGHGLASLEYPRYRHHAIEADQIAVKAIGDEFQPGMVFAFNIDLFYPEWRNGRDRLRLRRDHPHHRDRQAPDAQLSDHLSDAVD